MPRRLEHAFRSPIRLWLILRVFTFRHPVPEKGVFPHALVDDYARDGAGRMIRRAGVLPWLALAGCVRVIVVAHWLARLH